MFAVERQKLILSKILKNKSVSVADLSEEFGVSVVTIRKDLEILEKEGNITRTFGGALLNDDDVQLSESNLKGKTIGYSLIVNEALKYISDGQTILLGQGPFILELARAICQTKKNLTVVTASIDTAVEVIKSPNNDLVLTGGILREKTMTMIGHIAERVLSEINADLSFVEVEGISKDFKITTSNIVEANIEVKLIDNSIHPVILVSSNNFEKTAPIQLAAINTSMTVITDADVSRKIIDNFKVNDFRLVIAK